MTKDMIPFTRCPEREASAESFFSNRLRDYPFAAVSLNTSIDESRQNTAPANPRYGIPIRSLAAAIVAFHARQYRARGRIRVEPRAERTRPFLGEMRFFLRSINSQNGGKRMEINVTLP